LVWEIVGGIGTGIYLFPAFEYGTPFTKYGYPVTGFEFSDISDINLSVYYGAEWPLQNTIYVTRASTLRVTVDQGSNWSSLGSVGANFVPLPQTGGLLSPDWLEEFIVGNSDLTAGNADRVHYTMDNGATWFDVSTGLPATDVRVLRLLSER
jgi:hypothetical protein